MTKVSVILPAYNSEQYLAKALDSLQQQSWEDFEVIIINDGSSDRTAETANQFVDSDSRFKLISLTTNSGICLALNTGVAVAQGEYLMRLDADDFALPTRIEKQVAFLDAHPEIGIVGSQVLLFNDQQALGKRHYPLTDQEIRDSILIISPFCHPAIMLRRSLIDKFGGYDLKYQLVEDRELYLRLGEHTKFANLPDYLTCYRVSDTSSTPTKQNQMERMVINLCQNYAKKLSPPLKIRATLLLQSLVLKIFPAKFKYQLFQIIRKYFFN